MRPEAVRREVAVRKDMAAYERSKLVARRKEKKGAVAVRRAGAEAAQAEAEKEAKAEVERTLPNRIAFGTRVVPRRDHVAVEQWLTNGTGKELPGLRVQDCVLLKGDPGFASQTNTNKVIRKPYVACRSNDDRRWIIAAWEPCQRPWANPPCPCLHSDPKFPDCPPGASVRVRGGVWFYEGPDIEAELRRIELMGWRGADGR